MNTLQLSKDLSVRQIAAIVKRLSQDDRDKLMELIWNHVFVLPKEDYDRYDEWLKEVEKNPDRLIPAEELKLVRIKR